MNNTLILTDEKNIKFIGLLIFVILFLLTVNSVIVGGFIYWRASAFTVKNVIFGGIMFFIILTLIIKGIKTFILIKTVFIDPDERRIVIIMHLLKKVIEIPFDIIHELDINTRKYLENGDYFVHTLEILNTDKKVLFSTRLDYLPDFPEMIDNIKVVYREIEK